MKRIVILCDGTWNKTDTRYPTNVVRLAQIMKPISATGIVQVPIYIPGVGTGEGVTKVAQFSDKMLGGILGWGLFENIVEAYRHLVFLYEPGDEIFIFGFSRGAFTARSLTGFIRSSGIVRRDDLHFIPEAVARYRKHMKKTQPDTDDSHHFRAKLSPLVVTSDTEAEWRKAERLPVGEVLRIRYLGVWDSVGALGIPAHLSIAPMINRRRYEFHDAKLSSMVLSARHAVALDERRPSFEPTLWENIEALNKNGDAADPPYQEKYFLGDHGSVGGGGDLTHLSSIGLQWIIEGAQGAGLEFDAKKVSNLATEQDVSGVLRNTKKPPSGLASWLMRFRPKDRKGPSSRSQIHESVYRRWAMEGKDQSFKPYRPGSLRRIEDELAAYHAEQIRDDVQVT